MFENYLEMSDAVKASVKALHKSLRSACKNIGSRYDFLVWAYVRGLPYHRIERTVAEGNEPSWGFLHERLVAIEPALTEGAVKSWLANPDGAIPVPVRERKPYIKPVEKVAE